MDEPNWIATILISLVLSIPLGIFINIVSPAINNMIKKFAISTSKKKAIFLKDEFERVKNFRGDPIGFQFAIASRTLYGFLAIFTFIVGGISIFFLEIMRSYYEITSMRVTLSIRPEIVYSTIWGLETFLGLGIIYVVHLVANSIFTLTGDSLRLANFDEYKKNYKARLKQFSKKTKN